MNRDGCICGVDWFFCIKCVQVYGDEILCLLCIDDEPLYGLASPQSSIVDARNLSCDLYDAITKKAKFHRNMVLPMLTLIACTKCRQARCQVVPFRCLRTGTSISLSCQ